MSDGPSYKDFDILALQIEYVQLNNSVQRCLTRIRLSNIASPEKMPKEALLRILILPHPFYPLSTPGVWMYISKPSLRKLIFS